MSKYDHRRPRYVREWYLKLKNRFKKREYIKSIKVKDDATDPSPAKSQAQGSVEGARQTTKKKESVIQGHGKALEALVKDAGMEFKKIDGSFDEDQGKSEDEIDSQNFQEQYYEEMIDKMNFSEDEEEDDDHLIKGAAQFLPTRQEKKGSKKNDVNQNEYFDFFQYKHPPDIARYSKKWIKADDFTQSAIRMTGKSN